MAGRIQVEPVARAGLGLGPNRTERNRIPFGLLEAVDLDVQVELLRVSWIRPPRRSVVRHLLHAQLDGPAIGQASQAAMFRAEREATIRDAASRPVRAEERDWDVVLADGFG